MTTKKHSYLKLFLELLRTDLFIFKDAIKGAFIDCFIWFTCLIVVTAYVFPLIGMQTSYGPFVAVGAIVSCIFWDVWTTATIFISDVEGEKTINYFLTLPLPNYLVLIKTIFTYAIKAGIPGLTILPLGKIFLWNTMSFAQFCPFKFLLIFVLTTLFTGTFSLFIVSCVQNIHHLGKIGIRYLFPMWFFGGANYPWQTVYKFSPIFAYISLANPLLYAMEGIHAAVLGQTGYLNFWLCICMLILFTMLFGSLGIWKLKNRLDFV